MAWHTWHTIDTLGEETVQSNYCQYGNCRSVSCKSNIVYLISCVSWYTEFYFITWDKTLRYAFALKCWFRSLRALDTQNAFRQREQFKYHTITKLSTKAGPSRREKGVSPAPMKFGGPTITRKNMPF